MWITTIHIVIVYYFCASLVEATNNFETNNQVMKSLIKRSINLQNTDNNLSNIKLRHQSRYPNLDKVMTKLNNMKLISDDKNSIVNKLRHSSWYKKTTTTTTSTTAPKNQKEIFQNYFDDDDYENDKEDDDDWAEYEDDDDEYEEYDDFLEWQAEEPTSKPTTTTSTTPIPVYNRQMSRISEMKWKMYGTREKIEENRKKELFTNNVGSETLARVHYMRVRAEGTCKKPLPRVISVQTEHPDPSRSYTPHCTVLHRCADDTGCCLQHNMKCGPKKQEEVQLYFYAKTLGTLQSKIEKLTFWNHTECTCVEKTKNESPSNEFSRKHHSGGEFKSSNPNNIQRCQCPGSFIPTYKYESQCTCSCQQTNPDCIRMKNGLEYFSLADRKCVLERKCGIPVCEFGAYLRPKGRCPRKEEKLEAFGHLNID